MQYAERLELFVQCRWNMDSKVFNGLSCVVIGYVSNLSIPVKMA